MKYLFVLLLIPCLAFTQAPSKALPSDDVFIPRTLSAGTSMSARTGATTLDDTTQAVTIRGFSQVILAVQITANDSINLLIQYQPSYDGVTFFATFQTIDSLVASTSAVLPQAGFLLPAKVMGFQAVRFRVKGQAHGLYADSPTPKVTTRIIRKQY